MPYYTKARASHWFELLPEAGTPSALVMYQHMITELEKLKAQTEHARKMLDQFDSELEVIAVNNWTEADHARAKFDFIRATEPKSV
jgi:hypothetical protein